MLATMFLHQKNSSPTLWKSVVKGLLAKTQHALMCLFVLFLTLAGQQASGQTVSIATQPGAICEGNFTTIFVTVTGTPSVGIKDYKYDMGGTVATQFTPTYSHLYAPGNHTVVVTVTFNAGGPAPITSAPLSVTVFNKPIVNFTLLNSDTQCLKDNSVCFKNLSVQAPPPSNPTATYLWVYGNGFQDSSKTTADQCHHYNAEGSYGPSLTAWDTEGCRTDFFLDPSTPIVIDPLMEPKFDWLMRFGPCFISNYLFKNQTLVPLSKLKSYTWDFGDDSVFVGYAPFDSVEIAFYDTIGHNYTINGNEFYPALTVVDLSDCSEEIRYIGTNAPSELPKNHVFEFDVITTKDPKSNDTRDSVCIGSYNSGTICFKQTPITGAKDFLWNFDDPASMQQNFNNTKWDPCHTFQGGMKTYYVTLTLFDVCTDPVTQAPLPISHTFKSAATFSDDIYLDKVIYANNDKLDPASRPRLFIDTIYNPRISLKGDKKQLVYANSYQLSGGPYMGEDTLYAYQEVGVKSPVYYISNDAVLFNAGVGLLADTLELPFTFISITQSMKDVLGDTLIFNSVTNEYDTIHIIRKELVPDTTAGYHYYGYGARVIGPFARIEKPMPPPPVVIAPHHLNQCGPSDTVDFVNTSMDYKSRMVYRLWDFDDNFAPQCTSFSVAQFGYPPIIPGGIKPLDSITYDNGQSYVKYGPDTIRQWVDALQQYNNSDHYFIVNGQTYGGKVNCKFSYDSIPRHFYPNWDTIYRYYEGGHDFMPWDPTRYGLAPAGAGKTDVHPYDTMWWGKQVFLNPVTGEWSLTQGSGPAPYGQWVRIDTIGWQYNNDQDLKKGEPVTVNKLPDPFHQANVKKTGQYPVINGGRVEPGKNTRYTWLGKVYTLNGSDTLPDGQTTFYEYAFKRTITRCITVRLTLKDSLNNESLGALEMDSTKIDTVDCQMEASVQLPFAKADARGLAKRGKECPGLVPFGGVFFEMNSGGNDYPGLLPSCGQTFILFNYDSLADRMDGTPCALDAFTSFAGGATPGGQSFPPYFTGQNFGPPPTQWASASGTSIAYHYGLAAGNRPPPADTAQGWLTVGIAIGSGCKDTLRKDVFMSTYRGQEPFYHADITAPVVYPPGASTIPNMPTDYVYKFTHIKNKRVISLGLGLIDTLADFVYQDCNFAKCMSDTVWYHRFMRINNLTALFEMEPGIDASRLRHKGEEITVHYQDSIQDDIKYSVWQWADNTVTVDSFYYLPDSFDVCLDSLRFSVPKDSFNLNPAYYTAPIVAPIPPEMQVQGGATMYNFIFKGLANQEVIFNGSGYDTIVDIVYTDCEWSNGYYINGVRRVRYNFDIDADTTVLLDSTVWPVRASGIGATDGLKPGVLADSIRRDNFNRIFVVEDRAVSGGRIAVLDKCTMIRDTMLYADTMEYYPVVQVVDSAFAFFPVKHVFKRTSWEVADKVPGATIGSISHRIVSGDPQNCSMADNQLITIGIIDTFDIMNGKGEADTLFCENEPVYFVDSLRYFRWDCKITDVPNGIFAESHSLAYAGPLLDAPYRDYQIDSADFWRQDVGDPRTIQNIVTSVGYQQWDPFSGTTITTYKIDTVVPERMYWDFGDGSPIDSSSRPVHKYQSFGRYKVTLVSRDSLGWFDTCVGYVNISRPVAKIDFLRDGNGDPISTFTCGALAQMLDSSRMATAPGIPPAFDSIKINYWWFGDKHDTARWQSTDNPNPGYFYRTNGTFEVKLVVETYQGCLDTIVDTVFIQGPRPMIQLMVQTDTIGCAPFTVKILNLADSLGRQIDANGNEIVDSVTQTTYIFWGDKNNSQTVVLGRRDTVSFTYDTAGVYYIYAYGSDAPNAGQNNCDLVLYPDTPNMEPIKLEVIQLKREILLDKEMVCVDQPYQLSNNSDDRYSQYTYIYEKPFGVPIDSVVKHQFAPYTFPNSFDTIGTYRIIARPDSVSNVPQSAIEGCKIPDTLSIKVVEASPQFTIDTVGKPNYRLVNLSDTSLNVKYEWLVRRQGTTLPLYSYTGTNEDPHFSFDLQDDTGTYEVCLTSYAKGIDPADNCSDSTCQIVSYLYVADFKIPNVFSPDGDGMNDLFKAIVKEGVSFNIIIYNRWGAKVYESDNPGEGWNGKKLNEGAECPPGVYYFICDYELRAQEPKTRTGTVTLIR